MKEENITLIPVTKHSYAGKALNSHKALTEHGWLDIPSEGLGLWRITDWHSFDDIGNTIETLTIQSGKEQKEIYSTDEGETFTFDLREN